MIEPQHLLEIVDFTMQTWNLNKSHRETLQKEFSILIENCISEQICAIDYKNQAELNELRAGLNNLNKGLKKIEDNYTHNAASIHFLGSKKLIKGPQGRSHFLSGEEDLKEAYWHIKDAVKGLDNWLGQQKSNPKPQKYTCRILIISELLKSYTALTGRTYKPSYGVDRSERIHNEFTLVAFLIDTLYGNTRPDTATAHDMENGIIKITNIVDCDQVVTQQFCDYIYDNFPNGMPL